MFILATADSTDENGLQVCVVHIHSISVFTSSYTQSNPDCSSVNVQVICHKRQLLVWGYYKQEMWWWEEPINRLKIYSSIIIFFTWMRKKRRVVVLMGAQFKIKIHIKPLKPTFISQLLEHAVISNRNGRDNVRQTFPQKATCVAWRKAVTEWLKLRCAAHAVMLSIGSCWASPTSVDLRTADQVRGVADEQQQIPIYKIKFTIGRMVFVSS